VLLDAVAPWIIDAWLEVLAALSFELPVIPLNGYHLHITLAVAGLILLALSWRMVGPMPRHARIAALSLLTLAMLTPLAIATSFHLDEISRLPEFAGRFRKPASPVGQPHSPIQPMPDSVARATVPELAPEPTPEAVASPPLPAQDVLASRDAPPSNLTTSNAANPPAPPAASPLTPDPAPRPTPTQSATATARKVISQVAKLLPRDANSGLMPVFYGTDRSVLPVKDRHDYTQHRAGRLEVGHAFVQIPRHHLVSHTGSHWTATRAQIDRLGGVQSAPATSDHHFAIAGIKPLSHDDFLEHAVLRLAASQRDKDHALVFVPGHNTSFDTALYRAAQIAYDLRFDGAPFVYSWPSNGTSPDYKHDTEAVAKAGVYFAEFVRIVVERTGAKSISFIAHGLGTRLTLDTLATMKDKLPAGVTIRELILTTPDIDATVFTSRMTSLAGLARRTTLYVASTDRALNISRRYTGGVPRAGDVLAGGPLVIPGVETIDISIPGTQGIGLNHPNYIGQAALIGHLASRLREDAELQSAALESVPSPTGPYFRLR